MSAIYTQNLNLNPIVITADIAASGTAPNATGWKGQQTLVGGVAGQKTPTTIQNPNPVIAQPGLLITKIMLVQNSTSTTVAGAVYVQNPNDNTYLFPGIPVTVQTVSFNFFSETYGEQPLRWKDFIVTGLTATATALFLWYKE
jgi:hypothetical protein